MVAILSATPLLPPERAGCRSGATSSTTVGDADVVGGATVVDSPAPTTVVEVVEGAEAATVNEMVPVILWPSEPRSAQATLMRPLGSGFLEVTTTFVAPSLATEATGTSPPDGSLMVNSFAIGSAAPEYSSVTVEIGPATVDTFAGVLPTKLT